jgi:hypothetical protein
MTLAPLETFAPLDARSFSCHRHADANPAACHLAPLVRLLLLAALGGALIFLTASPENVRFLVAAAIGP